MNLEHELRVIQGQLRDHRAETADHAKRLRADIAALGDAMRLEMARELVAEHPELSEPVRAWLARYGLALEEHLADD